MEKSIIVNLEPEKSTKNCVKFVEKQENEFVPELLGSLYVQKSTLAGLKFNGGKIAVTILCGKAKGGVVFTMEKTTQNTVKFAEVVENEFVPVQIGSIYVPKATLAGLGYSGGEITVKISIVK